MKRGFAELHQRPFTLAIELLYQLGRYREALDTAEQARGRAFADLLAEPRVGRLERHRGEALGIGGAPGSAALNRQ